MGREGFLCKRCGSQLRWGDLFRHTVSFAGPFLRPFFFVFLVHTLSRLMGRLKEV